MELKDVILSTLAEMENSSGDEGVDVPILGENVEHLEPKKAEVEQVEEKTENTTSNIENEMIYLDSIRERLLVLFEGFQAPNNTNIEAKVDMTLNFLEYTLATIDARLEVLKKGNNN